MISVYRPVGSSDIKGVSYNDESQEMSVTFHKGPTYTYLAVPKRVFIAWKTAESAGKYFHAHIKNQYQFRKETN